MVKSSFFFILFLYILSPRFSFIGLNSAVFLLVILLPFSLIKNYKIFFGRNILFVALVFLIIGIYSAFAENAIYDHSAQLSNFAFLQIAINNIVYIVFSLAIYTLFRSKIKFDDVLYIVGCISVVNSLLILVSFALPEVREFLESILVQNEMSNIDFREGFRFRGLAASGGFGLATFNVLSAVFIYYLYEKNKIKFFTTFFSLGIIFVSQFFIARTGLIFSGIIIFVFMIRVLFSNRDKFRLFLSTLFIIVILIASYTSYEERLNVVLPWALELFYNFVDGRGFQTSSSNDLMTMFDIPSDWFRLIFGFGFYESNVYYRSDSGYVKTLYAVGLIGLSVYLIHAYFLFLYIPQNMDKYALLFLVIGGILFLFEVKGPVFYQNYTARTIILLYIWAMYGVIKPIKESRLENPFNR